MLDREYSERSRDEYTIQDSQLVPAVSHSDLFPKYKNSGDKIDKPGKTHPESY
jgi:hypothetical protein